MSRVEEQLDSLKSRLSTVHRKTREESGQLQAKAVMLVTAAGLGYVEGTETRTATPSGLRIGGFTPSQVIGLGAAAVEVWSDDRDTKLIASGVSNGGLSISAYKMGYERGMQGGSPPTT